MANEQNLLKGEAFQFKSGEEAAKSGAKGGRASGAAKRRKKDLRKALEILLDKKYTDSKSGKKMTGTEALAAKLFEQGMKGNIKAFETIRATVGQDPVQKIMVAEVEQSIIDEVERAVLEDQ